MTTGWGVRLRANQMWLGYGGFRHRMPTIFHEEEEAKRMFDVFGYGGGEAEIVKLRWEIDNDS